MVDSYMSASRRRSASWSVATVTSVSLNQPRKNTICESSKPYFLKLRCTSSSEIASCETRGEYRCCSANTREDLASAILETSPRGIRAGDVGVCRKHSSHHDT